MQELDEDAIDSLRLTIAHVFFRYRHDGFPLSTSSLKLVTYRVHRIYILYGTLNLVYLPL